MKVSAKEKRIQKEPNGMLKLKNTKTKVKNSLSGLKNRINRTEEIITECENKQKFCLDREKRLTGNVPTAYHFLQYQPQPSYYFACI